MIAHLRHVCACTLSNFMSHRRVTYDSDAPSAANCSKSVYNFHRSFYALSTLSMMNFGMANPLENERTLKLRELFRSG